jgi:hypothetical protein
MPYKLNQLAPGSYDVVLNGVIIAGLVRSGPTDGAVWVAELLVELPNGERPAPFERQEHVFPSMRDAKSWLGISDAG